MIKGHLCVASSSTRSQSTALPIGRKAPKDEPLGPQAIRGATNPSPHLRALLEPASKPILLLEPPSNVTLGDADSGTGEEQGGAVILGRKAGVAANVPSLLPAWFQALSPVGLAAPSQAGLLSSPFPQSSLFLSHGLTV